jgi:hypothetical protein
VEEVRARASHLPDLSVEQIFGSGSNLAGESGSRLFTVRTSERAPELVQVVVSRLMGDDLRKIAIKDIKVLDAEGKSYSLSAAEAKPAMLKGAILEFQDPQTGGPAFASLRWRR